MDEKCTCGHSGLRHRFVYSYECFDCSCEELTVEKLETVYVIVAKGNAEAFVPYPPIFRRFADAERWLFEQNSPMDYSIAELKLP